MTTKAAKNKRAVQLIEVIQAFRQYNHRMEAQQMLTLLLVYQHAPIGPTKLGELLGMAGPTAGRNLYALSDIKIKNEKGHGLVDITPDPMDRRYKLASLSPAGEKLMEEILGTKS